MVHGQGRDLGRGVGGPRKWWYGMASGQEILCIGCLEQRLGRTLMDYDFTDARVNDPFKDDAIHK